MRVAILLSCLMMTSLAQAEQGDFNPYTKSYLSRTTAAQASQEPPKLFAGQDRVEDYYRLLEDGYDMLGYSSFETGAVPPEEALQQAKNVGAALVLVYNAGVDHVANRRGPNNPASDTSDGTIYQYFASYWAKLPAPLFGVHVQRERPDDDAALEVMAVIKGSPAAAAGLQRGDLLIRFGEVALHKPDALSQAAQRYAGQTVEVVGSRAGAEFRKTVTLNRR